jgi:hypothetical protein
MLTPADWLRKAIVGRFWLPIETLIQHLAGFGSLLTISSELPEPDICHGSTQSVLGWSR